MSLRAGDFGAYACGTLVGQGAFGSTLGVEYPASSPYVVAVGGTTLTVNIPSPHPAPGPPSYAGETAWTYSGGGYSSYELRPSWQAAALPSSTVRGVPDVALDADPASGVLLAINGQAYIGEGGTSVAAPLFAGMWARFETAYTNSLGFASPTLYGIPSPYPTYFHDITSGANGAYSAVTGWDAVTGLGSPIIDALEPVL